MKYIFFLSAALLLLGSALGQIEGNDSIVDQINVSSVMDIMAENNITFDMGPMDAEDLPDSTWMDAMKPDDPGDIVPEIIENDSSSIAYI